MRTKQCAQIRLDDRQTKKLVAALSALYRFVASGRAAAYPPKDWGAYIPESVQTAALLLRRKK